METAVFVVCAVIVLSGGLGVVFARNSVHAALGLVATLFGIAVLFLNLDAQLLAAIQVIVYTGAIVVLILFVMMLLGVDEEEDIEIEPIVGQRVLAGIASGALVVAVLGVVLLAGTKVVTGTAQTVGSIRHIEPNQVNIAQIGKVLFTDYVYSLEVTAALLTVAVVAAVVMARRIKDVQDLPEEPESMTDQGDEPLVPDVDPEEIHV